MTSTTTPQACGFCPATFPTRLAVLKHETACPVVLAQEAAANAALPVPCGHGCPDRFPTLKAAIRHSSLCPRNTDEETAS